MKTRVSHVLSGGCAGVRLGIRDSVLVSFQCPFAGEPLRVTVQFAWHLAVSSLRRCRDDSIQIVRTVFATLQKYNDDTDRLPYRDRRQRCEILRIHLHLRRTAMLSLQKSNPLKRGWHGGHAVGATPDSLRNCCRNRPPAYRSVAWTSPSISFGIPVRISRKLLLHTTAQIWPGRFDQRMNVIWHPAKGQHDPATPGNFVAKSLCKSRVVSIIMK